ncbi:hypothetical protein BGZ60DRAFT_421361 [Tricladium varicosporioides]|nr:hypothetical protein BGZ60DRAFT_421361 [Hymenoscyphus varicosporioides]
MIEMPTTITAILPPEIISHIINFVLTPADRSAVALPPAHIATKTFLSLCRASHVTKSLARPLLYRHCAYLDSIPRVRRLYETLRKDPTLAQNITSLYLSPYVEETSAVAYNNGRSKLWHICSLLLALRPSLICLILNMPLRTMFIGENLSEIRNQLRQAFESLTMLEVFCSVQDELYLPMIDEGTGEEIFSATTYTPTWTLWPRLKILGLYNVDAARDGYFFSYLAAMKNLETVILTRADCLEDWSWEELDAFWKKTSANKDRGLDIILVNTQGGHRVDEINLSRNEAGMGVGVKTLHVSTGYYADEDDIELCQKWVERNMLAGQLIHTWS